MTAGRATGGLLIWICGLCCKRGEVDSVKQHQSAVAATGEGIAGLPNTTLAGYFLPLKEKLL